MAATLRPAPCTDIITPFPSDLAYLEAELEWVTVRCRRIGTARRIASIRSGAPAPRRRRDEDGDPDALSDRLLTLMAQEGELRTWIDACRVVTVRERGPLALDRLCDSYALSEFERHTLLLAVAPCFSASFDEHFGEMLKDSHHSASPSVEVLFAFAELGFAARIRHRVVFATTSPLVSSDLVAVDLRDRYNNPEDLLTASVTINATTFNYLLGDDALGDEFLEFSSIEAPLADFDQVVLADADKRRILSVVESHEDYLRYRKAWGFDARIRYGRGALMLFYGPPGTGKTMTAHAVAEALDKRVLNVDIPTFLEGRDSGRFLPGLFREARPRDAILFFDECEVLFGDRRNGNALMTLLLTELERFEGVAIMATNLPEALDPALDRRILVKVRFPEPDRQSRLEIWRKHLPDEAPLTEDVDLEALASRFELTGGYIKNAVLSAVATAVHRGGDAPVISMAHLEDAALQQTRRPCDEDDEDLLVFPTVRLADVVLPDALMARVRELVDGVRNRRMVLERWGIGEHLSYGLGISALFHGEPGTGKTLAAEAVAAELNRPLLRASVPTLVSKWVGQTERNLNHLFQDARAHGAVLFLDEADTLLRCRGEGRASRHDDSVVNVLLQLIERHEGIVLLATNLPDGLDPALGRRLTAQLTFPFPNATLRSRIWRRLLPDTVPTDGTVDVDALGREFRLSGGLIKNVVFRAAFRAASAGEPLSQARLRDASAEELGVTVGGAGTKLGF
jgi:SpoVK/Ycf46/Vps4 family AAA+-type ATPase